MALNRPYTIPGIPEPVASAYIRVTTMNLNFVDQVGRVELSVYYSKEARDAGDPPMNAIAYMLEPNGRPAYRADGSALQAVVEEDKLVGWTDGKDLYKQIEDGSWVKTRQKNEAGEDAPDVPAPGVRPPFPSFEELTNSAVVGDAGADVRIYDLVKAALYKLLRTQPELLGSADV